jgi:hypothetical protein
VLAAVRGKEDLAADEVELPYYWKMSSDFVVFTV